MSLRTLNSVTVACELGFLVGGTVRLSVKTQQSQYTPLVRSAIEFLLR